MTTPTSSTRIPIALIALALLFRIGAFLLWPVFLIGIIALCVIGGKFFLEAGRLPIVLIIIPIIAVGICVYGASLTMRTIAGYAAAVPVRRNHQPNLWTFVTQVAESVGGRAPDNIIIGMEANFYVTQSPVILMTGPRRPVAPFT